MKFFDNCISDSFYSHACKRYMQNLLIFKSFPHIGYFKTKNVVSFFKNKRKKTSTSNNPFNLRLDWYVFRYNVFMIISYNVLHIYFQKHTLTSAGGRRVLDASISFEMGGKITVTKGRMVKL